jgi:hypothetical protein
MRPPCYECPDRAVGCHGKCERYIGWSEEYKKDKEPERSEKRVRNLGRSYASERYRRLTGKKD